VRRGRLVSALVAVVLVVAAYAYGRARAAPTRAATTTAGSAPATVHVTRQSLAEVVTLPATVVAAPQFSVSTEFSGPVTVVARTRTHVAAGSVLFRQRDTVVRSPVDATVLSVRSQGVAVAHLPFMTLSYDGFGLAALITPVDSYRILSSHPFARAEITNGPGPFPCTVLASVTSPVDSSAGVPVICAIPQAVPAYVNIPATLALTTRQVANALVLPTYAVAGTVSNGEVYRVAPDGNARPQAVSLGVTNGGLVQITSGLTDGDTVLTTPPNLSPP